MRPTTGRPNPEEPPFRRAPNPVGSFAEP